MINLIVLFSAVCLTQLIIKVFPDFIQERNAIFDLFANNIKIQHNVR